MRFWILTLSGLFLLLTGCASLPDDVAVEQPDNLPAYSDVKTDPGQYQGREAVFGGNIVRVINQADVTTVEVLQLPLYSSGRPQPDTSRSLGRPTSSWAKKKIPTAAMAPKANPMFIQKPPPAASSAP